MDGALLNSLINEGSGGSEVRLGCLLIPLSQRLTEGSQCSPEPGFIGPVDRSSSLRLAGAL